MTPRSLPKLPRTHPARGPWLLALLLLLALGAGGCRRAPQPGAPIDPTPELEPVADPAAEAASEIDRERLEAARRAFDERLATRGIPPIGRGRAYGQLGTVYHAYDLLAPAAAAYRNAGKLDPRNHRWPYLEGVVAARLGDAAAARGAFQRALELRPGDPAALARVRRLGAGDPGAELEVPDPLLARVAGQRWSPEAVRARRALDMARFEEAAELAAAGIAASPGDANLHLTRATALAKLGREAEAVGHFEEILRVSRDPVALKTAHVNLAVKARAETDLEQALVHLRGAVDADPDDKNVVLTLAVTLQKAGRHAEAAEQARRAVEIDPTMAPAQFALAHNLALSGRWPEARAALEEVQSYLRDNPIFQMRLARVLAAAPADGVRDGARALEVADRAWERGATAESAETRAMALAELGRWDEAVELQERALEMLGEGGRTDRRARLEANLERYRRREPARDPAI